MSSSLRQQLQLCPAKTSLNVTRACDRITLFLIHKYSELHITSYTTYVVDCPTTCMDGVVLRSIVKSAGWRARLKRRFGSEAGPRETPVYLTITIVMVLHQLPDSLWTSACPKERSLDQVFGSKIATRGSKGAAIRSAGVIFYYFTLPAIRQLQTNPPKVSLNVTILSIHTYIYARVDLVDPATLPFLVAPFAKQALVVVCGCLFFLTLVLART